MLDTAVTPVDGSRPAPLNGPILATVNDTLQALHIGRSTFYLLVAAGELEIVKVGSATRVVVESLKAYVDRLRAQAQKAT
jgi:excisionase family DNA binding protein